MSKENKALDKQQNGNNFIADVMRSYLTSEIEIAKINLKRYGWIHKQFKHTYNGQITALENVLLLLKTEYYS